MPHNGRRFPTRLLIAGLSCDITEYKSVDKRAMSH